MNPVGLRKAAAYLAGIHPADKQWLLAQLPVSSAHALVPLIKDAEPLVRSSPDLLNALLLEHEDVAPELPTPDLLIAALNTLEEGWAARVMKAAAPDHAEIYLAACFRSRALGVREQMSTMPPVFPAALSRCLADELATLAGHVEGA